MSVRVTCPGCGGAVVFGVGTGAVAVCEYCRSVVARSDRGVENLGKVADLIDTGSGLRVGLEGRYDGVPFRLTGRAQLEHPAGGVWDEWYAAFDDGRWGWLAEAQGRFALMFEQPDAGPNLPPYAEIDPGVELRLGGQEYVVSEEGVATTAGADGEIPYRLEPGHKYAYADLSGPDDAFATLDYSDKPPTIYIGREVTLDELGLPDAKPAVHELKEIDGTKLGCPNCGGALDLKAPDRTERVFCPYCGSILDCDRGNLRLLKRLKKPKFPVHVPIGSVGTFPDGTRTVVGVFNRSVKFDRKYYWQEYLLYDPRAGFEWLVCSDHHWSRVKAVPAGDVRVSGLRATCRGVSFRKFQDATATVEGVVGECYWKIRIGEKAETSDFVSPPLMLSREVSKTERSKEINYSVGIYMSPGEVRKTFQLPGRLPTPIGVGPNQPFLYGGIYKYAGIMLAIVVLVGIAIGIALPSRLVEKQSYKLEAKPPPAPVTVAPGVYIPGAVPPGTPGRTDIFFTDKFTLDAHQNILVTVDQPELTGWMVVEGDLVRQETGEVQPFIVPMSYYFGVEDGESWTEGSREESVYVTAQPPGEYSLRLEVEREKTASSAVMTVEVRQGVARFRNWFLLLLGVGIVPAIVGVYHFFFSQRRWKDSDFSPYGSA